MEFEKGQLVLSFDARQEMFLGKLTRLWHGPYRSQEVKGNKVLLEELDGILWEYKIYINKIKSFFY